MNKELLAFLSKSKLKKLIGHKRNFIGSKVEYVHDSKRNIYSIKMKMAKGEEYVLTLAVGPESVEMALSDKQGHIIEHLLHDKNDLVYG